MQGLTDVPFAITRVFVVKAASGDVRGEHAHKACTQFLTCPYGSVEVLCNDGRDAATFVLDRPDVGLLVPASIWATQTYRVHNSVLTVLCDQPYDPDDYIRDFNDYKRYRAGGVRAQHANS
jgi:hypothetical protein